MPITDPHICLHTGNHRLPPKGILNRDDRDTLTLAWNCLNVLWYRLLRTGPRNRRSPEFHFGALSTQLALSSLPLRALPPGIDIIIANDVILAQVDPGLHLDDHHRDFPGVLHSVHSPQRDVD